MSAASWDFRFACKMNSCWLNLVSAPPHEVRERRSNIAATLLGMDACCLHSDSAWSNVHIALFKRYWDEWRIVRHWEMPRTIVCISVDDSMPDGIRHARPRRTEQCHTSYGHGSACVEAFAPLRPTDGLVWRRHYNS